MIYAIAVLGLNILTGYNGQISLGHGGFFAAGAYTAAILMHRYGVPYWATLPPAGLICFVLGVLFGLPALRFEGPYLALVTLAMALATPQLLKYFDTWTGGQQGINLVKPVPPAGLGLSQDRWLYLIALLVLLIAIRVAANMLNGRTGRAWVAIRDQPIAAAAMGIDTARYKTLAFGTSTLFTGVAGALSAIAVGYVSPESYSLFLSVSFLVGSAVGGISTIGGAIVGGFFIQFVPNFANDISDAAPWAIYGLAMLLLHVHHAARRRRLAQTVACPPGAAGDGRATGPERRETERHDCSSAGLRPDRTQCGLTASCRIENTEQAFKQDSGGNHVTKADDLVGTIGGEPPSRRRTGIRGRPIRTRRQRRRNQARQHHAL